DGAAPAGEQAPVFQSATNPGFVHTPSLTQASSVALLRSGHLAHTDTEPNSPLAIDLSSERVRLAEWLLDGVRQGQPLGALLGYRFERHLQDGKLGQFIPLFREVAPLVAKKFSQTMDQAVNDSVESIAANNVVDGLVLYNKWKNLPKNAPMGPLPILFSELAKDKAPDLATLQQARSALQAELDLLDEAVDALSDAFIAESVHHAVQG